MRVPLSHTQWIVVAMLTAAPSLSAHTSRHASGFVQQLRVRRYSTAAAVAPWHVVAVAVARVVHRSAQALTVHHQVMRMGNARVMILSLTVPLALARMALSMMAVLTRLRPAM